MLCLGTFYVSKKSNLTVSETNAFLAIFGGSGIFLTIKNIIDVTANPRENEYYFLLKLNKKINK